MQDVLSLQRPVLGKHGIVGPLEAHDKVLAIGQWRGIRLALAKGRQRQLGRSRSDAFADGHGMLVPDGLHSTQRMRHARPLALQVRLGVARLQPAHLGVIVDRARGRRVHAAGRSFSLLFVEWPIIPGDAHDADDVVRSEVGPWSDS